jgi:pre-mRNA 3'-end-processing factor FIP1
VSTSLPAQVATGAAVAQQQLGFPSEAFASTSQTQYPPPTNQQLAKQENGGSDLPDPSSLPPVRAPSSHPPIEPNIPGTFSDRPIYEVDIQSLADKTWRRPGSNLSDWFNYGFDEISWEAYCVRRRELGTIANELKTSVLNLAALPEDSFQNTVPPEMRSAVIAQAAMMGVPPSAYPQAAHHGYPGGPHGMGMMHHPGMVPPEMMGMNMNMGMGMQQGMQQGMNGMNMGPPGMNVNAMGMSGMESGPGPGMGGGQGPGNGEEGQGDGFNNYNNNMVNDYGNGPGVQVQVCRRNRFHFLFMCKKGSDTFQRKRNNHSTNQILIKSRIR